MLDRTRVHGSLLALTFFLLVAAPGLAADGGTTKVYRLGNPATTISTEDTKTAAQLQERVREYASALQVILAQSSFDGDPQDFFDAIENGQFEETSVTTGSTFPWMSYRKGGNPALLHNVEWAGKNPFVAWRVTVETRSATYYFIIPGTCLNLALESKVDRPPLVCDLRATAAASTTDKLGAVRIEGSVRPDGELAMSGIGGPGRTFDASMARAAGNGRFSFQPPEPGTYTFQATARDRYGRETVCDARATVQPKPVPPPPEAVCRLNASYDGETGIISLDADGAEGTVTITGMDAPDGATGGVEGGNGRWTVAVDKKVRRRGGDYVFRAEAKLGDDIDRCDPARVSIPGRTRTAGAGSWILRGFGFAGNGGDRVRFDTVGPTDGIENQSVALDAGDGIGLGLEYLVNPRIGIEGAVLYGEADGNLNHDRDEVFPIERVWAEDDDDVSFRLYTVGVNFHLTPDRRADLYIGPFLGFSQYSDGRFDVPGRWIDVAFDDDFGVGAQIGVDILFKEGGRWGFNSALRYLQSSVEVDNLRSAVFDDRELDLDPLFFSAGLSFRF